MTDRTQNTPALVGFSTLFAVIGRLFGTLTRRPERQEAAPDLSGKRMNAGLSPDLIGFDWGHMGGGRAGRPYDPFR